MFSMMTCFDSKRETRRDSQDRKCDIYANIIDEASGARITVCPGETRYRHLYTTISNSVEIQIVNMGDNGDESAYFAIAFQGIICYISAYFQLKNECHLPITFKRISIMQIKSFDTIT